MMNGVEMGDIEIKVLNDWIWDEAGNRFYISTQLTNSPVGEITFNKYCNSYIIGIESGRRYMQESEDNLYSAFSTANQILRNYYILNQDFIRELESYI